MPSHIAHIVSIRSQKFSKTKNVEKQKFSVFFLFETWKCFFKGSPSTQSIKNEKKFEYYSLKTLHFILNSNEQKRNEMERNECAPIAWKPILKYPNFSKVFQSIIPFCAMWPGRSMQHTHARTLSVEPFYDPLVFLISRYE